MKERRAIEPSDSQVQKRKQQSLPRREDDENHRGTEWKRLGYVAGKRVPRGDCK